VPQPPSQRSSTSRTWAATGGDVVVASSASIPDDGRLLASEEVEDIGAILVLVAIIGAVIGFRLLVQRQDKEKFTQIGRSASTVIGGTNSPTPEGIHTMQDDQTPRPQPTPPPPPAQSSATPPPKTPDQRKAILAQAVANSLARPGNWRIESQSDYNAVIVKGRQINHVLHLLLTVFTVGIWLLIWMFMGAAGGETRYMMTVDEYGNTNTTRL